MILILRQDSQFHVKRHWHFELSILLLSRINFISEAQSRSDNSVNVVCFIKNEKTVQIICALNKFMLIRKWNDLLSSDNL